MRLGRSEMGAKNHTMRKFIIVLYGLNLSFKNNIKFLMF